MPSHCHAQTERFDAASWTTAPSSGATTPPGPTLSLSTRQSVLGQHRTLSSSSRAQCALLPTSWTAPRSTTVDGPPLVLSGRIPQHRTAPPRTRARRGRRHRDLHRALDAGDDGGDLDALGARARIGRAPMVVAPAAHAAGGVDGARPLTGEGDVHDPLEPRHRRRVEHAVVVAQEPVPAPHGPVARQRACPDPAGGELDDPGRRRAHRPRAPGRRSPERAPGRAPRRAARRDAPRPQQPERDDDGQAFDLRHRVPLAHGSFLRCSHAFLKPPAQPFSNTAAARFGSLAIPSPSRRSIPKFEQPMGSPRSQPCS